MTDDRSLERAARSWLEAGPTQAPHRAVEAALLRIETTPQERDLRIPWRLPEMFTPARLAAAAVIGVLLVGGAFIYAGGRPPNTAPVATPSPRPSASAPAASPSPSLGHVRAYAPDKTWGDWETEAGTAITPYASAGERIQWSIDWQDGLGTWLQTSRGDQVMRADSVVAQPGEIHLLSTEGQAGGCSVGDEGRYTWSRSADGLFLTLTKVEDACQARAAILSRTWVHPLDAVNDGGPGVIPFAERWLQMTLPSMRFAMGGSPEAPDIRLANDQAPSIRLVVIKDPRGFAKPCSTSDRTTVSIPQTTAGFVAYVRGLPGLNVKTTNAAIDGRPAVHVEVSPKGSSPCGVMGAFHSMDPSTVAPEGEWDMIPADRHSFWIVDVNADTYLLWYEGGGVTPGGEQAVISSAKFFDKLPTP